MKARTIDRIAAGGLSAAGLFMLICFAVAAAGLLRWCKSQSATCEELSNYSREELPARCLRHFERGEP